MEEHGKVLANSHQISNQPAHDQLLARLANNEAVLANACRLLRDAAKVGRQITPGAEWLLDNFYLIEEQIRTAKLHLPKGYSKELPRLSKGSPAGYPRVYDIALEIISHGDGRVTPEGLSRFVAAYQQVTVLKLGELWAIPIMLRLALIENLRRVAARLAASRHHRNLADAWADRMIKRSDKEPSDLIILVADMARSHPPMDGPFVAELVRRLQGQGPALMLPLTWLAQHLAETGLTIEELIQIENQQQASDQVSVSNSIGSLRFLGKMDWRKFVETMSVVEQTLRKDSAGVYAKMDFATRDQYRHIVERIGRNTSLSEAEIANYALELAKHSASKQGPEHRQSHIGYYLVDKGLPQLEHLARMRLPLWESLRRRFEHSPLLSYLGPIFLLSLIFTGGLLLQTKGHGLHPSVLIVVAAASLLGTSQLAIALVNWLITLFTKPHYLPRMDFSAGIPSESSTLVVVPTMLLSERNIESLCDALEVRFLANRDENLRFCLLTDFADAATETTDADAALLRQARENISALNEKYGGEPSEAGRNDKFLLLHRPRRWNAQEKIWMGHERKRGKLADLNAYLRDPSNNAFSCVVGNTAGLTAVKYVITLDTDTRLERDSARQFVGAISHPLNRAVYDERQQRVTQGYGILQPRVSTSLPSRNASRYGLLFGGEPGIDPYTRTVSDVYQDVFGEGSFVGKGIYDVDAFERALANRLPENRILSHDLLEGCYARCGLISDVQLHEEYPVRYSADVKRRHRWIRGDWQLAAWLLPRVPVADTSHGRRQKNPLSTLSRWKLLDNLRRSAVPTALTALLLLGWSILPSEWLWTTTVLSIFFLPPLLACLIDLLRKPDNVLLRQHVIATARHTRQRFAQALLSLIFLPYETLYSLDAIIRTLWRQLISHKNLLEWNPSHAERAGQNTLEACYRRMWASPFIAIASAIVLAVLRPEALVSVAAPVLLLWLLAPAVAWWVSQPLPHDDTHLTSEQTLFLHRLSRKTWAFFEQYVGPDDNWLPPDNVQVEPIALVAHRTSPTNIGLALLATLAAYDFGYIVAGQLIERCANTLRTMDSLERHQGHFYNWYDTQHLTPLLPMYISTVDSGNLAGHLMTLRPGLLALLDAPIIAPRLFEGIHDTLDVLIEGVPDSARGELNEFRIYLSDARKSPPTTLSAAWQCLRQLTQLAEAFANNPEHSSQADPITGRWIQALGGQCLDACNELRHLAPWCETLLPSDWDPETLRLINTIPTLRTLAGLHSQFQETGTSERSAELGELVEQGSRNAAERIALIGRIALQAIEFARMEYDFLYDKTTHLLAIGYNVSDRRLDTGYYDLLASEARLCSFVAISQGQLPQENWFALGRQLTIAGGDPILLSWSGSMFEYLMPLLVMPRYDNTLLDQTYKAAVKRHIDYGAQRNVPWGLSESGFYTFDAGLNYQYRAFGVPGLGLRRGLGDDLVVAPYASMLALMVAPDAACVNLQKLAASGFGGEFGFYEAVDYTPSRLPRGKSCAIVKSFMSHHQGMGFLSLTHLLLDQPMQKRFESDPLFQATMLLLQERIPKATASYFNTAELADVRMVSDVQSMPMRLLRRADTRRPEVQLLSNGRYHVMVTNSGGGSSRWRDLAVTRWREDSTRDHWGSFCYIRDLDSGLFWSTTYQPTLKKPENYEVIFSEDRAEFRRRDNGLDLHTEIVVSPEDDIELRRVHITNRSRARRTIDITSYNEVVLATAPADAAHPTFSNLFVQTEILEAQHAVICTRRPRSRDEKAPWMLNLMTAHGGSPGAISFETDRAKFTGRGNVLSAPDAMTSHEPLSGTQGSVLDPIVAIRHQITLNPEQSATVDIVTGMAETRDGVLHLIGKYQDRYLANRVFELAWTHNHVVLRQLNASDADAQLYGRMASSIIYANSLLRADASILIQNRRQQSGLWGYGISGDLPIVLLQIKNVGNIELVRQLVQAHAYWRMKGLSVDLVIWNEDHASYRQILQDQIMGLIISGIEGHTIDRPGGIFVRMGDQISAEDRILLQSVARLILSDSRGTLTEQLSRRSVPDTHTPVLTPGVKPPAEIPRLPAPKSDVPVAHGRVLFNGLGGFAPDGSEYVITTATGNATPAPWVNVVANPSFGSVISESGQMYTWGENAHEFRLTPWDNDPVSDLGSEAFYLRDEQSGYIWSPTPLPRRRHGDYTTRHGFGYSVFEHTENGIYSELWVYVALDASIKYSVLKVRNNSGQTQILTATGYVQWVLGDLPSKTAMHVITEVDPVSGALLARNAYSTEFSELAAFFDVDATTRTLTGDRSEFIGRNGSLQSPAALTRVRLSGKVGAGLDPCAAIQVPFELVSGQERELVFTLGVARRGAADVSNMIQRYRGPGVARQILEDVRNHWRRTLGAIQIETPDPSLNMLANGWLVYQTIASRLWARSGYYQSGGAYGFRDQLQDVMALVHAQPHLVREHLLRAAAHQFVEGDVQHWWHPPSNRGVRTHCSDDYLWLPLATCRYVRSTGDRSVLDETAPFLEGRAVNPDEDSYYDLPLRSSETASLYQHCVRAITHGMRFGVHGLPLMGSCDWNDGMDKVGHQGRGESVWLGFFLYDVMTGFAEIAELHGDPEFARRCHDEAAQLRLNIEKNGWDGEWYRRAWFDDGTPLGSSSNPECRIDSISQSWSVLSGAADATRATRAMQAVNQHLVRREDRLIQLLDPPFDKSSLNPGYIRGYVPGVRENGGQYTHAAIWAVMAFAKLGEHETAWELLDLINPVKHGATADDIAVYKVEPYVMAADVYAVSPHTGRGGWTWYTGSSSWMYRLIIESLLGLHVRGDTLTLTPSLPAAWPSFTLHYRFKETNYHIAVERVREARESGAIVVDGAGHAGTTIPLHNDGKEHTIQITLGVDPATDSIELEQPYGDHWNERVAHH